MPAAEVVAAAKRVTGLPATWSTDSDLWRALIQRLKIATGNPDLEARVIAEPLAIVYVKLLNNDGDVVGDPVLQQGKVAVIDLGHHTVDVGVIDAMRPQTHTLATFQPRYRKAPRSD
jgi:molecular chaperone DnaK (HSP70)